MPAKLAGVAAVHGLNQHRPIARRMVKSVVRRKLAQADEHGNERQHDDRRQVKEAVETKCSQGREDRGGGAEMRPGEASGKEQCKQAD